MINDMIGNIRGAIGRMEGLRYSLVKLPKSARKNMLMDAMDDYLAELNNTLSNMDQSNKVVAANLLNDFQNNEAERQRVREDKKRYWGSYLNNKELYSRWDMASDWLTMTNSLFFEKYGFNWIPTIELEQDVKDFMNKYGNITEDDLKKPYGATGRNKTPALEKVMKSIIESGTYSDIIGLSCPTKPLGQETINKFTKDDIVFAKRAAQDLTQNQLNTLGGLNTPNYNLYR